MYELEQAGIPELLERAGEVRALVQADCRDALRLCPPDWAALVHTSPPYNIGRRYKDFSDARQIDQYCTFLHEVISELSRILKPGGSLFWQTGYTEKRGRAPAPARAGIVLLDSLSFPIFAEFGFVLWDRIVWNYFGSMAFKSKFTNRHETILWLVKPGPNSAGPAFNLDEVRERAVSYDARNHILGRNPGNVWQADRVAYGSTGQTSHPAVFPEQISEKIVRSCSQPGDVVVDPFVGSGTTCKVSLTLGRQFLGCDISQAYIREADERLGLWTRGELWNLALGILVLYAFGRRPGAKSVAELDKVFCLVCRNGRAAEVLELRERVQELLAPSGDTAAIKRRKQDLWKKYDELIRRGDRSHPMVVADQALCFCFAHRRRWNGVRRSLSAGLLLKELSEQIMAKGERERAHLIRLLCLGAPTRFRLHGSQIELRRADPGLGCNAARAEAAATEELQRVMF
jgi:adenine-specific DNA-methyltransferase